MEISATINKLDIIKANIYLTLKLKILQIFIILLIFLICTSSFLKSFIKQSPLSWKTAIISFLSYVTIDIVVFTTFFAVLTAVVLIPITLWVNKKAIGKHKFIIEDEGFREITNMNDILRRWEGIESIIKTKSYIFIRINLALFHIIPKRAFKTKQRYEEFWHELNKKYKQISSSTITDL